MSSSSNRRNRRSIQLLVKDGSNVSEGQKLVHPSGEIYGTVEICKCSDSNKTASRKISTNLARSFRLLLAEMQKDLGPLKTTYMYEGEGGFGVVIQVQTESGEKYICKVQKCHSCDIHYNHYDYFIRELNATKNAVKDSNSIFLLPYSYAYHPSFNSVKSIDQTITKTQNRKHRMNLGIIAMRKMERTFMITGEERDAMIGTSMKKAIQMSFVWGGSLLGIMGELIQANRFHSDLKEENIVGMKMVENEPTSYIWKAIDFAGSGSANSMDDFDKAFYTYHYRPLTYLNMNMRIREYTYAHDVCALAHVLRNMLSFMTGGILKVVYQNKDNMERFLMTSLGSRKQLTLNVLKELSKIKKLDKNTKLALQWCCQWIHILFFTQSNWNCWNVKTWWKCSAKRWLQVMSKNDVKNDLLEKRLKELMRSFK